MKIAKERIYMTDSNTIAEILFAALIVASVVFARDVFALQSPILRLELFDIGAGLFILASILTFRRYTFSWLSFIPVIALFGIALTGGISTIVAFQYGHLVDVSDSIVDTVRYLLLGSVLLFGIQTLRTQRARDLFLSVWLGCAAIVAVVAVGQTLAVLAIDPFVSAFLWENIRGGGDRIASTMRWQGPLVAYLGVTLPLALARAVSSETGLRPNAIIWRVGYSILSLILVSALFFTGSRSALLMLPLSAVLLLVQLRHHPMVLALISIIIIGLVNVVLIFQTGQVSRIIGGTRTIVSAPLEANRVVNWTAAIDAWLSTNIPFGLGPRQTVYFTGKGAHSSYVGIAVERGLIGIGFLAFLIGGIIASVGAFVHRWRTEGKLMSLAFGVALLNFLIYAGLAEALTYRFLYPFLVLALARVDTTDSVNTWTVWLANEE